MTEALLVVVDDVVAGTLTRLRGGRLRFDYAEEYRERPNATPLSVSMPIQVISHPDHVVAPWLWGLLPDNEAVLRRWAREFHASASSPFSMLATPIGHDCAGAVRFVVAEHLGELITKRGSVKWLSDDDVAKRLHDLKQDSTAWLGEIFTGQFSLAGAQAKTALLYRNGRWGVPSGSTPTSHILKPAVAGLDDHDLNEHLCLDAARLAGLTVVRTRVARFGDESAIVVDRYDRIQIGSHLRRIHQEDICQALGVHPDRKYQNQGGPGPKDVVRLFRQSMSPSAADEATWRFVDALAWNWLIAGTDAHAKNYSLLIAGNELRLAPLYDVASALLYGTNEKKLRLAMKVGNDYRVHPYRNAWPTAARDLGLDPDETRQRVDALALRAPDAFADAASTNDVAALGRELPARLVDLIANRVERCRAVLRPSARHPVPSPAR